MADPRNTSIAAPAEPWFRNCFVWLVIAGPAFVVVASIFTFWIAAHGSDKLVQQDYYRKGIEINRQIASERALLPAMQGRNHAATPTVAPSDAADTP
ncbi:MAG: nitrogen fixation protein FixH [Frateuria sp.]|nr:nitrogen fixation protein FixH [Frateuria sp.]